jgi:uncharacterized protein YaaR (DUF327 family)
MRDYVGLHVESLKRKLDELLELLLKVNVLLLEALQADDEYRGCLVDLYLFVSLHMVFASVAVP